MLDAFYRSEESCDNGRTALGGTYTFMLSAVQNRTASNDDNNHVQSYDIVGSKNELMLSC